ncbi:MAG: hypothetical protein HQK83_17095 [Fibrobacteria bacterium]|nr:hypothetical protein [Fibrobacteria bacterium]
MNVLKNATNSRMVIKPMLKVLFLIIGLGLSVSWGSALSLGNSTALNYEGYAGFENWVFLQKIGKKNWDMSMISARVELLLQTKYPVEFYYSPKFTIDFVNTDRSRLLLADQMYIDYLGGLFEIRGGYQIFDWSMVESFSQIDFINQRDYEYDILRPQKFGELALRTRMVFSLEQEHYLELMYLPEFTEAPLPQMGNNYELYPQTLVNDGVEGVYSVKNIEKQMFEDSTMEQWHPQGAIRYHINLEQVFESSLFYFNGYDRYPTLFRRYREQYYYHWYNLVQKMGGSARLTLQNISLKGEFVYTTYQSDMPRTLQSIPRISLDPEKIDPYYAYTAGVDYHFSNPRKDDAVSKVTVEALIDSDAEKGPYETEGFRPFKSHIYLGYLYRAKAKEERTLKPGVFINYKDKGTIYRVEYNEWLFDDVLVRLVFDGFFVSDESFFQMQKKNMRLDGGVIFKF